MSCAAAGLPAKCHAKRTRDKRFPSKRRSLRNDSRDFSFFQSTTISRSWMFSSGKDSKRRSRVTFMAASAEAGVVSSRVWTKALDSCGERSRYGDRGLNSRELRGLSFCFEGVLHIGATSSSLEPRGLTFCFEGVLHIGAASSSLEPRRLSSSALPFRHMNFCLGLRSCAAEFLGVTRPDLCSARSWPSWERS